MTIVDENHGYKFYREVLKCPKFVVAPMVDASELAFRELCRKYGAQLAYTPMMSANLFNRCSKFRDIHFFSCNYDRPLIAQFCCNDVDAFLQAVEMVKDHCDAVDINLGCPQYIAKRGHYGAFLQDEWNLISSMIKKAVEKFDIPITCKIRVFDNDERTLEYAKMIERSGCSILTVHGRTREMKGPQTGLADWNIIKRIKEELKIPVFANGNIQTFQDVQDCLEFTKVDAVMSAEGLLANPALFSSLHIPCWVIIDEYLELIRQNSNAVFYAKGHLFKFANLTLQLPENHDLRTKLSKSFKIDQFQELSNELRKRYEKDEDQKIPITNLPIPHYMTQPYYHYPNKERVKSAEDEQVNESKKRKIKVPKENFVKKKKVITCLNCPNVSGQCDHSLCRKCCKDKCFNVAEPHSCTAHQFRVKQPRKNVESKMIEREKDEKNQNEPRKSNNEQNESNRQTEQKQFNEKLNNLEQ